MSNRANCGVTLFSMEGGIDECLVMSFSRLYLILEEWKDYESSIKGGCKRGPDQKIFSLH